MQITIDIPDNLPLEKLESLLKETVLNHLKNRPDTNIQNGNINRHAGLLHLTQDPLVFQQTMRDEWL